MLDFTLLGGLLTLITTPLAWKWGLGVRRTALTIVALAPGLIVGFLGKLIAINVILRAGLVLLLKLGHPLLAGMTTLTDRLATIRYSAGWSRGPQVLYAAAIVPALGSMAAPVRRG